MGAGPNNPAYPGLDSTGLPDTGPSWLVPHGFTLALGVRAALAAEDRVFVGALLALALRFQRVELGLSASTSLPDTLETQALQVTLREHSASAELMLRIPLTSQLELSVGAEGTATRVLPGGYR